MTKMNSEFELLTDKVNRLAELTHALRLENASLRRTAVELVAENKDIRGRMLLAQQRVENLLEHLPKDESSIGSIHTQEVI